MRVRSFTFIFLVWTVFIGFVAYDLWREYEKLKPIMPTPRTLDEILNRQ